MTARRTVDEWRAVVDGFAASGLSIGAYCQRARVSRMTFSKWRKRLMVAGDADGMTPKASSSSSGFLDLGSFGRSGRFELRLDLGDGLHLTLVRG